MKEIFVPMYSSQTSRRRISLSSLAVKCVVKRLFFNFQGTNGSATKLFSAYTMVVEKMLAVHVDNLLDMSPKESDEFYRALAVRFCTTPTCIELSHVPPPLPGIPTIKWVMKDLISK